MARGPWFFAAFAVGVALTLPARPAVAEPARVSFAEVRVPEGLERLAPTLRSALKAAARKADFGKSKRLVFTAKLVEFEAERRGDVLRIRCTIVGRLANGPSARSFLRYGGSIEKRAQLEKEVLTMVANGLVGRLATIVRSRTRDDAD